MSEPINPVVSRKITGSSTGESRIIRGNIDQDIPWEERKMQVVDLCKSLWPTAVSHECDDDAFVGGYNEVYFVTITESNGTSADYVIRCPQETWWFTPLIDSVAILHHIKQTTSIRVPSIIAFDTTPDNPLKSKYIVLERLKGKTLQSQIHKCTTEQRVALAKELGELYTQFRSIKMPHAGRIVAAPSCHITSLRPEEMLSQLPVAIEPYGARCPEKVAARLPTSGEVDCFWTIEEEFLTSGGLTSDPPNLPLAEAVTRPFDRRIVQETTSPYYHRPEMKASVANTITQFANLYIMIETIVEEEKVEDASGMDFYLWHSDLLPRNIMVDIDSSPMITGIIDWDEAVYAPKFATALAPWWLWELPPPEEQEGKKAEGEDEQDKPEDEEDIDYLRDAMEDERNLRKGEFRAPRAGGCQAGLGGGGRTRVRAEREELLRHPGEEGVEVLACVAVGLLVAGTLQPDPCGVEGLEACGGV
ncbi:kinase-like domain-containing protein [Coniochaeta sp. 2T2.1]|nr:kinase-like domain-containing protein [Coniochaeta sp. 2T2.1]